MRFIGISIFILLSNFSIGQTSWFRHLPGWQARNSLVKGDTILTCGMDNVTKSWGTKLSTFIYWNSMEGDSIDFLKINLDTLENDSFRSTVISYNYTSSLPSESGSQHFLRLGYGNKKSRAFIINFDKFFGNKFNLKEYTKDTFSTFINNIISYSKGNILFIPYYIVEKPLQREFSTMIIKERNGIKTKIYETSYSPSIKYETTCHIKNAKSDKSFFFIKRQMWDYAGAPRMWADYIMSRPKKILQFLFIYPEISLQFILVL